MDDICRSCGQAKHKYPGRLGERTVQPRGATLLAGGDKLQAQHQDRLADEFELLSELMGHYRIDPANPAAWIILSLKLARAHVQGFQARRAAGRPKDPCEDAGLLWVRVQRRMKDHHESERAACTALAREDRRLTEGRAYLDRYQRAKRSPAIRLLSEARKAAPDAAPLEDIEALFQERV